MNLENIKAVMNSRGFAVAFKPSRAGTVAGVRAMGDTYICSLVPIDDESDMRFCDALESWVKEFRAGTFVPTCSRKEIEG